MRFIPTAFLSLSLVSAGFLAGCQSEAPSEPPAGESAPSAGKGQKDYARELLALKSAGLDQETLEARHRDLLLEYGYPLPEGESRSAATPATVPGLAKAASVGERLVKSSAATAIYRTFANIIEVGNGENLKVNVVAQGAADPFLTAFYFPDEAGDAVRYVIAKDDSAGSGGSGSLNPNGSWTNATGASRTVYIVVFAALTTARGTADIHYRVGSGAWQYFPGVRVGGTVRYANQDLDPVPAGCGDLPTGSRFSFKVNSGSNSMHLMAYNNGTNGGIFKLTNRTLATANSEWIPAGQPVAKSPIGGDVQANHHFVLATFASGSIGTPTVAGGYTYSQTDLYPCP